MYYWLYQILLQNVLQIADADGSDDDFSKSEVRYFFFIMILIRYLKLKRVRMLNTNMMFWITNTKHCPITTVYVYQVSNLYNKFNWEILIEIINKKRCIVPLFTLQHRLRLIMNTYRIKRLILKNRKFR